MSASRFDRNDYALFAMRGMLATVFVFHGAQKLFGAFGGYGIDGTAGFMESIGMPFPVLSAIAAGGAEFVGGLALATGLGMRLLSVPLVFTMLTAAFTVGQGFDATRGGMEYPLTLAVMVAGIALVGPGRLALRLPLRGASPAAASAERA